MLYILSSYDLYKSSQYIYEVKWSLIVIIFLSTVVAVSYEIMEEFYLSLLSDSSLDIFP